MESTFLLHKPISYGSSFANTLFLMMLLLHIIAGAIAPVTAIVALTAQKGGNLHMRFGRYFVWSMLIIALTGIMLDVVRLGYFVKENHTKYADYTMPSTYPARLGFLFVGLCILYILREVTPPRVFRRQSGETAVPRAPSLLVATGLLLTFIIALRFNPWTGALWMIWTFIPIVIVMALTTSFSDQNRGTDVARHRLGMSCLAAFSWWGAFQGFGPAIIIAINGDDPSTTPYLGDQPGPFSPAFLFFLAGWAPFFFLAAYLIRRFAKLRHA